MVYTTKEVVLPVQDTQLQITFT